MLKPCVLDFFVPGHPRPQGSKDYLGNGRFRESSPGLKSWRADVRDALIAEWGDRPPLAGGVALDLLFVMPRPKSLPKRKPTPQAIKRPDWDKLCRAISDAITSAQVYKDDSQVINAHVNKAIAEINERSGVWITILDVSRDE